MSLRVSHLQKSFGKRKVVNDVTLSVDKGEIVGLLGPNGAGKSTSFYMIVGLLIPDSGNIKLNKENITRTSVYKRCKSGIGYLPQEASIFRKMTVYDNIMSALEFHLDSKKLMNERATNLIEDFNLTHVVNSYGYALSGGERRRVEIARCLATDPSYILLDEPFAGIDPISVQDIQSMVFSLKERGIGVLITDHNVRETLKITDRSYIIAEGRVLTEGKADAILDSKEVRDKYLGKGFTL